MACPVADRWAHVYYWRHGGFDVVPAPGFDVSEGGWSTPAPMHERPVSGPRAWWGWDVISNPVGNWLVLAVPGALLGLLAAWLVGASAWLGAVAGAALVLVGVALTVAAGHLADRKVLVTMGFGRMDQDAAEGLAARLRAEGIGAHAEPSLHDWRVAVPRRYCDRATELAEDLGLV